MRPLDWRQMMQRGARIIGMAPAVVVAAFILVFVSLGATSTLPGSALIGLAYIVAAAVILLAPISWAAGAAIATAGVTVLLVPIAAGNHIWDGLILLAASLIEAGAAWALQRQSDSKRPPGRGDRLSVGRICPHCGKEIASDRKRYCNHCGLPFDSNRFADSEPENR